MKLPIIYESKLWRRFIVGKFFILFLISSFSIYADTVFIPKEKADLSNVPPFVSVLAKYSKELERKADKKVFEQVVEKVVHGDDKDLEKQADELLKDRKKLDQFLAAISKDRGLREDDDSQALVVSKEIQQLLDEQYKFEKLASKPIALNVKQADIKDVIELVTKTTGLDFVIDAGIRGTVSNINLKEVSAAFALRFLLSNNNPRLALIREFDVLRIVRFPEAVQILKGKLQELRRKELMAKFFTLQHAKLTENLRQHITKMWEGIVGKIDENNNAKGYYLVFDDNSKKIFFRSRKSQTEEFENFLKEIDVRIPQVRIEARVILAKKDFEESVGFDWSGMYNRNASVGRNWHWLGHHEPKVGDDGLPDINKLVGWSLNFFPTTWATKGGLSLPFIFGSNKLDHRRLNLRLNMAESRNEIRTLLKPSLLVNSGEDAEILVGKEIPIKTIITDHSYAQVRNLTTVNYKELGMKLKVKPIVSPDFESVFLDIFVENSAVSSGDTQNFNYETSQITTSRSQNRVLLKSGQTTLIGGLISNQRSSDKRGMPVLQDIPLLGLLFRGSRKVSEDEQLLIFLTPTIV